MAKPTDHRLDRVVVVVVVVLEKVSSFWSKLSDIKPKVHTKYTKGLVLSNSIVTKCDQL